MKEIAEQLNELITDAKPGLMQLEPGMVKNKPNPEKWSKQEILGHLIDSASNNHHRFVRAGYDAVKDFPPYDPDNWVKLQQYNEMPWNNMVELFCLYNLHLVHVLNIFPVEKLNSMCYFVGKDNPVTIEYVIRDYLRHLKHHLDQILEK